MTDSGLKYYSEIMVTLGKKTKEVFNQALKEEFDLNHIENHQMLNAGDIKRVADKLKL